MKLNRRISPEILRYYFVWTIQYGRKKLTEKRMEILENLAEKYHYDCSMHDLAPIPKQTLGN